METENVANKVKMALWLPPTWYRLKPHLEQYNEGRPLEVEILVNNDNEIVDKAVYDIMLKEGNICMLTTNFTYKTHLCRALGKDMPDIGSQLEDTQTSVFESTERIFDTENLVNSSDEEAEFSTSPTKPAIFFLLYTKEDVLNCNIAVLKQRILTTVEILKVLYSNVTLVLVLHALRLYALHGNNQIGDTQLSQESQSPLVHNVALDEIICSLVVEHQVDTIEAEDDVELAKLMLNACSATELCVNPKNSMYFRSKPQSDNTEEIPLITRIWIAQLQQIPELGKEAAIAIANIYPTPSDIMEAAANSPELVVDKLRNINVGSRGSRKFGLSLAKRITNLFSPTLTETSFVMDDNDM
ncbi:uncharacterized protein BBOV_IV009540 [Babesia bovis T2Bo]|uniref:uncharacterized protein n=1 Tax=Babesia bovis T2Bo TaxID=484906 RepID=UPI001D93EB3B|nr:uncharacterized protein BBOV_IV009540 [Babesia bovis T2Bo]EDO07308.2 hypothetical protein BBOV_IV009540 [Babesia bovis T2Bo]